MQRIEAFEQAIRIIQSTEFNTIIMRMINENLKSSKMEIENVGNELIYNENYGAKSDVEMISEYIDADSANEPVNLNLVLLLLYNSVYFMNHCEDIAIRDRSFDCLSAIVDEAAKSQSYSRLVSKHLLPQIKIHLKNKNEVIRNCFIKLIYKLIDSFTEINQLQKLSFLIDKADGEKDFFLNITHIQTHRRSRALKRLAKHINSLQVEDKTDQDLINSLSNFILPIIIAILKDESTEADILDGAVETLGTITSLLHWNKYKLLLVSRLKLLTSKTVANQKLAIRCLVAMLDGFHFDIRNSLFNLSENELIDSLEISNNKSSNSSSFIDCQSFKKCSDKLATMIHKTLVKLILPNLHKLLTNKTKSDEQHKLADPGKYAEDEEILRAPIALAMIKLLKLLPPVELKRNVNGILIRICHFLGSRSKDIRSSARETIKKIMFILSPTYFYLIISNMKSHLQKGYQRHVLCFSVWSLLNDLKEKLKEDKNYLLPEHIDTAITHFTEIFNEEIFGEMAEEKKVEAITNNLFEARQSRSFESYQIVTSLMDVHSMPKIIMPLQKVLVDIRSHTALKKMSDVLTKISKGLIENQSMDIEFILTLIFTLTSESMDEFSILNNSKIEKNFDPRLKPPSCLLITKATPRGGLKPRADVKSNLFVLVEFGLNLLYMMLKKPTMLGDSHLSLLDPIISIILKSFECKNSKVKIAALKCLTFMIRLALPALKSGIGKFVDNVFLILKHHATFGSGKTENSDLVNWAFKVVCVILQSATYYTVTADQLQVLITYVEQDLHDYSKYATAFPLLQAIMSRKLVSKELVEIIKTIQEMAIYSEVMDVRNKCRKVVLIYLLDYPLEFKQMASHVKFFSRQLNYEYENGRLSALQMLYSMAQTFPKDVLSKHSNVLFLQLCQSRLNDDSANCLELVNTTLKILIGKIRDSEKDQFRNLTIEWFKSSKMSVKMLATLILGLFVEVEQSNFDRHLDVILYLLSSYLESDNFSQIILSDVEQQNTDRLLYNLLDLFHKIILNTNVLKNKSLIEISNQIWGEIMNYLKYDYDMVQLKSAQLLSNLLNEFKVEEFKMNNGNVIAKEDNKGYLFIDTDEKLHKLCGAFCYQLSQNTVLRLELISMLSKNLLSLVSIIKNLQNSACLKVTSVDWLLKRLNKEILNEVRNNQTSSIKRKTIYVLYGAMVRDLGPEFVDKYLTFLMRPLVRDVSDQSKNKDDELNILVQEVLDLLKKTIGSTRFSGEYARLTKKIRDHKEESKTAKLQWAVTNPDIYAKKKKVPTATLR